MGQPLQRALEGGASPRPALAEISHRGFVAHGVRTDGDKYIRRFSPDDDELYFDLRRDPKEQTNVADRHPERVRLLQAQAEAGMSPNPFRYVVQVTGPGRFALQAGDAGLARGRRGDGPRRRRSARALGGNGRWLDLALAPRPGAPREIGFTVRPVGAPVTLSGTRDGRPLRPSDVAVGEGAFRPAALPFRLPDIESETETRPGHQPLRRARAGRRAGSGSG